MCVHVAPVAVIGSGFEARNHVRALAAVRELKVVQVYSPRPQSRARFAQDLTDLPQPVTPDLNTLLAQIAGSLFADVDAKASFWQRARGVQPPQTITQSAPIAEHPPDIASMLEAFRFAYTNLHEIWSLVLPPNSLLGLKKLSLMQPENFRMPDNLWARIVYDFILAYRLRTINRGHLLGALTPLYLAWVASHLRLIDGDPGAAEQHIEATAAAFEADKPYIVARWRWPDRFNP